MLTNESSAVLNFTVSDAETAAANLVVSAVSLTPNIVNTILLGGSGESRTVSVTPEPARQGIAAIGGSGRRHVPVTHQGTFRKSIAD